MLELNINLIHFKAQMLLNLQLGIEEDILSELCFGKYPSISPACRPVIIQQCRVLYNCHLFSPCV